MIESGGVKLDFLGNYKVTPGSSLQYTFKDINLGAASSSGLLVFGTTTIGPAALPMSAQVNGNAATLVVTSTVTHGCAIFEIPGVSGAGDVTIFSTGPVTTYHIGLYKLRGLQTLAAHDLDVSTTGSLSFDVPRLGAGIAFSSINKAAPAVTSWTGLTENFDEGDVASVFSGASLKFTSAQIPLAVSTTDGSFSRKTVGASWR